MDTPITGETLLKIGSNEYTLRYTWREIVEIKKKFGKDTDLFDPEVLAAMVKIGLTRHHPEVSEDMIFDASPPIAQVIEAVNKALNRTYVGKDTLVVEPQNPPQAQQTIALLEARIAELEAMLKTRTESAESPAPSSTHIESEFAPLNSGT